MRKSLSPSLSDSLSTTRVFGIPLEEVQQSGQPGQEVPLLVKHIVEYIEEHGGLDLEGLFLVNGSAERVDWLRQRYDNGEEVDLEKEADLASAVSLLRLFLQELPEPVIPASLQAHILQLYQDCNTEEELARNMKYFLQQLPQVNYCLLRFLCRFLSNVASLQEESWSTGALAAVFGPDIFHIDTDVEVLKEQEPVSRILADLLENQEEFFDSEEEDFSTTNDYSSLNEQITELLDDEKLEQCEELPRDSEDSPEDEQPKEPPGLTQVTPSSSSHISPISILPASADIIERTIRAAVEQHLFDLQSTIDQGISSYESRGPPSQEDEREGGSEEPSEGDAEATQPGKETAEAAGEMTESEQAAGDPSAEIATLLENCGVSQNTKDLVDAENIINTARQESCQDPERGSVADLITCVPSGEEPDLNANSGSGGCPTPPFDLRGIFQDGEWEAPCLITFPLIDFKSMHLQTDGEDPVPAFKSWQEDRESGEAQLSPLAGRMVPTPSEEDAHPLLARRFLDFGHSQRFLHQDPDATSPAKASSHGRPRRASFSSKESGKGDPVPHQLTKKLQNLKKKIKQFEEQYEKERNYKPSYRDKAANPKVLKWMTDLTKVRKQIRDTRQKASEGDLAPQPRPRSNTLPKSFGSTLDQGASEGSSEGEAQECRPTREETLELIQRRLKGKREEDSRPEDVRKMTKEQLSGEKTVLQKNLLFYESIHGRPVTREERLVVKPLYDRYRLVKQMLTRASITPIIASPSSKRRSQMLQPIIEGETAHFCDEIKEEDENEEEEGVFMETSEVTIVLDPAAQPCSPQAQLDGEVNPKLEESGGKLALDLRLSSSNASSMPELLEQLWKARADKKKLRKSIREFEDEFYQQNGRNVQKEDRAPMMDEYKEYKRIKAKLRLLEVLISKQDSSKSI
ncbi:protein FAM13B isoform X1 [Lepisosteus oculatus]|uniref:Family with sequence similarity 13 member B n=1 Tax=Lepisosteus oculatus TaxID=7918 RepID=W5N384_LEPOC|nr:PREDICTED: protein FAM13B isoform X1 [Lepisosteus oculatus]XP_015205259.1 PREDICTED: protein FAM13B isoform X1 [Lepisosteus oculatus]XP_015205261.1 PREDICTED: protein FAM13B isoform X1 [Lepisosteus oculatus]XP_015205262.1 PREDICTED: protein FAM13B isoform X1 [Lepisosteus oculatus]XP_015205263.1 PREDICTED: protein FAM13B isoform X1 [Lepisosteus oculatus]